MRGSPPPESATAGRRLRGLVHRWPWRASAATWIVVVVAVGAVRHHYSGIYGFSTANYGWLGFMAVGGSGLAWRLAGRPPLFLALVRPLLAASTTLVLCYAAVALTGLVFLPDRPLQGGGDTVGPLGGALHPLGRALPVAELVVLVGYVAELVKALQSGLGRAGHRHPDGEGGGAGTPAAGPHAGVTAPASRRR